MSLKDKSDMSISSFLALVPNAKMSGSVAAISGVPGTIRVKRAAGPANQVHVGWGEPLAVHIPDADDTKPGEWVVLSVDWQLRFAGRNPKAAHHASSALDCMQVSKKELDNIRRVAPNDLAAACEKAIVDSQRQEIKFVTTAINRVLIASANSLAATYTEIYDDAVSPDEDA